jgi:hypothetical protein
MRRQRSPEIIDLISDEEDENEESQQQKEEESKPKNPSPAILSLNSRTTEILSKIASEVYSNSKKLSKPGAKFQAPLFYEQRLRAAEKDLITNGIQVHLGSEVVIDRASVFISFAAIGLSAGKNISIFEKYVRTLISFVSVPPAHGFMFASKCFSKTENDISLGTVSTKSDDDGEEFAADHLERTLGTFLSDMRLAQEKRKENEQGKIKSQFLLENGIAVCVSRWFGGVLLGPDRFKHIKSVSSKALEELVQELELK